jgi:PIN domain nuclease of toxin-antitoxin system
LEISIKAALGRANFAAALRGPITPYSIVEAARSSGLSEMAITSAAALAAGTLPPHHRDPFDRMIVAQAMLEPAMLYTSNAQPAVYSSLVVVV